MVKIVQLLIAIIAQSNVIVDRLKFNFNCTVQKAEPFHLQFVV